MFGLIDMNGRVYDPLLGRFLGVDPIIQMRPNTQNYNSYTYCLNNPLIYSDPSGYIANYDPWTDQDGKYHSNKEQMDERFGDQVNDFPSTTEQMNMRRRELEDEIEQELERQEKEREKLKKNESTTIFLFINGVLIPIQVPVVPQAFPQGGGDTRKDPLIEFIGFNRGIPEFESRLMPKGSAVTPGPFIIYAKGESRNPYFNTHEPGHVIQFLLLRGYKLYIPLIAIPSLISVSSPNHSNMPWEKSADWLWYKLTGEYDPNNKPSYAK